MLAVLMQNSFCVACALVSHKLNTCLLLRYMLYRHKGNTPYFLSHYPSFPFFFPCALSCPLQAHASSRDFDLKEPCSKSRVMSLVTYILFLQTLKHVWEKTPLRDWRRWYIMISSQFRHQILPEFSLPMLVIFYQLQLHLWGSLCPC